MPHINVRYFSLNWPIRTLFGDVLAFKTSTPLTIGEGSFLLRRHATVNGCVM
jgi:hypothetical protein